ncbi:hypothetical protein BQ9231_00337 [Cedratvirus lausannensis]|uniref:Uncharacterized protein n=1 Tax=Cedratvirus lausannensis TaxID=2023205 RepID=A0A285Q2G7_9VIRU|nr:hypothetical protein BQ9231_00337 [Cedratvirus lausannensis]
MQVQVLISILKEMEIKDILRISLVHAGLFDESMWRMLCRETLQTNWDDYYFLFPHNPRIRFAQIAQRKCFLPVSSPLRQMYFAVLNKRKDILERCCKEYPNIARDVLLLGLSRPCIYFNCDMHNFLYQCLDKEPTERAKIIADGSVNFNLDLLETIESNPDRNLLERLMLSIYYETDKRYACLYDAAQMFTLHENQDDKVVINKDNIEFWLDVYSISQKRDVIERLIKHIEKDDIRLSKGDILRKLYTSNNLDMARKFEKKFNKVLTHNEAVANLAVYYFNTGDDRGLYESLINLEQRGMIRSGPVNGRLVFDLDLPEVNAILERCGVKGPRHRCL